MSNSKTIHILHLEDNPFDAELTRELLMNADVDCELERIVKFEEFREILDTRLTSGKITLILADYNMPGFDGMTSLQLVREIDTDIPFILLSGALGEEVAVELLRSGATDYVLKNNIERLPLVVKRAVGEYHVRLREKLSQEEIRKARDEAEKANGAKGRFLGRISHELRTPLNAIIGYTQLMQADPMSDEQQHCTQRILNAGEHLLQLINEVLDITRIESGVIPLKMGSNSINPIIEQAVDLVRPMARDNNVSIHIDGGPCELFSMVDKDRLAQILINFLTNAVKYNRPGGHVYVECAEERPNYIKIFIRDTGIGIAPEKMERLFTPFDRLDIEKNSTVPGTGLGLTVSKALIEAMNGLMGVISSENEGSIFWLEVPASEAVDAIKENGEDSAPVMDAIPALKPGFKILLVENHAGSADFLVRVFNRRKTENVVVATTVGEALECLSIQVPDIVILDINFPDNPGEIIIEKMKENPEWKDIPVIVTAIDTDIERKSELEKTGVYAFLHKPLKINRLLTIIQSASLAREKQNEL